MRRSSWFFVVSVVLGLSCAPAAPPPPAKGKGKGSVEVGPEGEVPAALKKRIEAALEHVKARDLETTYGFWTIFHAILGLGPDNAMLLNPDTGERLNAIDYVCKGNPVRGLKFIVTPHGLDVETAKLPAGEVAIFVGQGHQDQFIAEMVQWGLPGDKKFTVAGKDYTFMDFVRHSKMRASITQKQEQKQELSWAILVIGEYFGTDHVWTNERGEKLHFEDIVRYELNEPIDTAACGGTHRLFGLTWAFHLHRQKGGKVQGVWKDLQEKLEAHKNHAKKHRNADGLFSTDYFNGPGDARDNQLRISTTGHILEWLSLYLPDRELEEAWVQEAANALAKTMIETRLDPIEGGALYHAAHGLNMYHSRLFGDAKAKRPFPLPVQ